MAPTPRTSKQSAAGATLAADFEAARKQLEINDTLKRSVLDADDAAKRIHGLSGTASKQRADVVRQCHRAIEQLAEFEKLASFKHTRRFNAVKFLEETRQTVGIDQLVKPGDRGSTEGLERAQQTARELSRNKVVKGTPLETFYGQALSGFDKALTLLRETSLDSATWANMPDSLFMLLDEVSSLDSPSDVVADELEQLKRMEFEVEELEHKQEEALADGDMKLMETIYFQRVTVQEAMVATFDKIFQRLDVHAAEAHVAPLKRVHDVHEASSGEVSSVMHRTDALKQKVEDDLGRLNTTHKEVTELGQVRQQQARGLKDKSDDYLRQNLMQIEQVYAAMDDLQKQLVKLSADRTDALEQRLQFAIEEDQHRADMEHFDAFYKEHKGLLEATLQQIEVSEEVTDIVDELLCNGCNAVEQRAKDNEEAIEKLRMETHEYRLKHFRQLYLTLGDLQYKKERNLEELDKKIQHVHIQQELAMETFNPKAKDYSDQKKALAAVRDEMQSQIEVLGDKAVLHIEAFKPTEAALIDAGKTFTHPVDELEAMNRTRQQKLLEYHTLMSAESGGDPADVAAGEDPVASAPPPSDAELAKELERIEREREALALRGSQRRSRPATQERQREL